MQHISENCCDYTTSDRLSLTSRSHVTLSPAVSTIRDGNSALFPEVEVAVGLSSIRAEKETIDLRRINRRGRSRRDETTTVNHPGSQAFKGLSFVVLALMKTPGSLLLTLLSLRYCKTRGGSAKMNVSFLSFFGAIKAGLPRYLYK